MICVCLLGPGVCRHLGLVLVDTRAAVRGVGHLSVARLRGARAGVWPPLPLARGGPTVPRQLVNQFSRMAVSLVFLGLVQLDQLVQLV